MLAKKYFSFFLAYFYIHLNIIYIFKRKGKNDIKTIVKILKNNYIIIHESVF